MNQTSHIKRKASFDSKKSTDLKSQTETNSEFKTNSNYNFRQENSTMIEEEELPLLGKRTSFEKIFDLSHSSDVHSRPRYPNKRLKAFKGNLLPDMNLEILQEEKGDKNNFLTSPINSKNHYQQQDIKLDGDTGIFSKEASKNEENLFLPDREISVGREREENEFKAKELIEKETMENLLFGPSDVVQQGFDDSEELEFIFGNYDPSYEEEIGGLSKKDSRDEFEDMFKEEHFPYE